MFGTQKNEDKKYHRWTINAIDLENKLECERNLVCSPNLEISCPTYVEVLEVN